MDEEEECELCDGLLEPGDAVFTTACAHSFHWDCLMEEVRVSQSHQCPSCLAVMKELDVTRRCGHQRLRAGHRFCRDCGGRVVMRNGTAQSRQPAPAQRNPPAAALSTRRNNNTQTAPPAPTQSRSQSFHATTAGALVRCPECQTEQLLLPHMYNQQVQCKYKHPFVFRVTGEVPTVRVQFSCSENPFSHAEQYRLPW